MAVNAQHPDYQKMTDRWKRCRDVYQGEDAVHDAGESYLPKLKDQTIEDYKAYVKRTPFYNATYRTLSGMIGMIFRVPPKIDVPDEVQEYLKDVTMSGLTLQVFAQNVANDAMMLGRIGILVDCPEVRGRDDGQPLTLADAMDQNIRPTMQIYTAESIINWKTRRVNNAIILTLVVLKEAWPEAKDEFEDKFEERYRVLDLADSGFYRVRIFEHKGTQDILLNEVYPLMNGKPIPYIPFVFVGADNLEPEVEDPPFIDLVNMNLSHYRTMADYEHGAHFTGLPTPYIAGYKPEKAGDKLYVGSSHAWTFQSPDVKVGYLEFSGQGLGTLQVILERKERQMAVLGARMLEPQKAQVEAADTQAQRRKGEESLLSEVAQTVSQGINKALNWFVEWADIVYENVFELNRDFFPVQMDPSRLSSLVSAWQQGAISYQTLFDNLKKGEVISEEVTQDEEEQRIQDQQLELAAHQAQINAEQGLNPDGSFKGGPQDTQNGAATER